MILTVTDKTGVKLMLELTFNSTNPCPSGNGGYKKS